MHYGATLPLPRHDTFFKLCKIIKQLEIKDVRLKMGKDIRQNHGALKLLRSMLGANCDLRVDPNMGWNLKSAMRHLPLLRSYEVGTLEQALAPGDNGWGELAGIAKTNGLKLQADESVCSMSDLEKVIEEGHFDIVNVRLSKCGGFRNSLRIIQRIRDAGLNYQVGCQLGESGILSAAGRALCSISSDALYYDGSYDRFLLRENLTSVNVNFEFRGKASPLDGPGLGITVNTKNLQKFTDYSITVQRPWSIHSELSANRELTMPFDANGYYALWREEQAAVLSGLKDKEVWVLFSGGKDSSLSLYFLHSASKEFGFSFTVHAAAIPKHRYELSEMEAIDSFWKKRGVEIRWHDVANSDDALEAAENPCLVCQHLRKRLLHQLANSECEDLDNLVLVASYDLSDLVSYLLERLTGHILVDPAGPKTNGDKERFLETGQRFYPILKMDNGYTIYRPILKYNEQQVSRIIEEACIPIQTVPCRYAQLRPKRLLGSYYRSLKLNFDYDRVFQFARSHLGLPPAGEYTSMDGQYFMKQVF
jgi:tRNA(Ile)-lysidine synthase TilS/MesJ